MRKQPFGAIMFWCFLSPSRRH